MHSKLHRQIEEYCSGLMTAEGQAAFEQRLRVDARLRALFEAEKDIAATIHLEKTATPLVSPEPPAALLDLLRQQPAIRPRGSFLMRQAATLINVLTGNMTMFGTAIAGLATSAVLLVPTMTGPSDEKPGNVADSAAFEIPGVVEAESSAVKSGEPGPSGGVDSLREWSAAGDAGPAIDEMDTILPRTDVSAASPPATSPDPDRDSSQLSDREAILRYLQQAARSDSIKTIISDSVELQLDFKH